MRNFVGITLAFLIMIGSCACALTTLLSPSIKVDELTYGASVRIVVICANDDVFGGSGVAISPTQVLTAKHVVSECVPKAIGTRSSDGTIREVVVDKLSDTVDVARLIIVEGTKPFQFIAKIDTDERRIGEKLCSIGGGSLETYNIRKCGDVAEVGDTTFVTSEMPVPGNSGSGVFDVNGHVVGILIQGSWNPSQEKFMVAVRASAFKDLVASHPVHD